MPNNRPLAAAAVLAGIVLLIIAVVYFADSAQNLPGFFPGHQAGSTHHHIKHGIAALVVALGAFAFAWFQTGPAGRPAKPIGR